MQVQPRLTHVLAALGVVIATCFFLWTSPEDRGELSPKEIGPLRDADPAYLIPLFSTPTEVLIREEIETFAGKERESLCRFLGPLTGRMKASLIEDAENLHNGMVRQRDEVIKQPGATKLERVDAEFDVLLTKEELRRIAIDDYWLVPTEDVNRVKAQLGKVPDLELWSLSHVTSKDRGSLTPIFAFDVSGDDRFSQAWRELLRELRIP